MRACWFVGIVGMSIGLRKGLRISCCRIIWFDCAEQSRGFNWGHKGYVTGVRVGDMAERGLEGKWGRGGDGGMEL